MIVQSRHDDFIPMDLIVARVTSVHESARHLEAWSLALSQSGSLFLIADWESAYELREAAERVFSEGRQLRNEIIWTIRGAQAQNVRRDEHFTILWYVKDPALAPFQRLTMPRSMETRRRFGNGRLVSSVNAKTGRRAPTRVDGASMEAPLNDVWIWDQERLAWVYELEEIDGRSFANAHIADTRARASALRTHAEAALLERFLRLTGCGPDAKILFYPGRDCASEDCASGASKIPSELTV